MKYRKHKDYIGQQFYDLKILDYKFENKKGYFYCECSCGNKKWMRSDGILSSDHKSCGCKSSSFKHGMSNTRLFNIWKGMKARCYNEKDHSYVNYGGRGIKICDDWIDEENGFINFYNWAIKNGYKDNLSIDRIDVNGNYEPNNCRWTTTLEQQNNLRKNFNIEINGIIKSVSEWSRISGVSRTQIKNRIKMGLSGEELIKPIHKSEHQSGVKGVKWDKYKERWKVEVRENKKIKHLGYFKDLKLAIQARKNYEKNKE